MATSDLPSLLPTPEPENRRQFLVNKLAAGFALAVCPVGAQTITTDTDGLTEGEVMIPVPDGEIPAYAARPSRGGNNPMVLVIHEIFGVHEHIKDICRRFAKEGYSAVAPALFARQGDVSQIQDIQQIIDQVVSKVPDEQVIEDLNATQRWAATEHRADPERVAVVGFCWGGRMAWVYTAYNRDVTAAAAFYGRIEGESTAMTPRHPLDFAGALKAPVIGFYGGQDTGISLDSIGAMRTSLEVVEDPSRINIYPDAEHGFFADYRPSYNEQAAKDAWQKMLTWFRQYGA